MNFKFDCIKVLAIPKKAIVIVLCLSPVVDMITGLLKFFEMPVSAFFGVCCKAIMCCVCIYLYMKQNSGKISSNLCIKLLLFIAFILCSIVYHSSKNLILVNIIEDVSEYVKLFFPLLLYYVLNNLIKINYLSVRDVKKIMVFYIWFVPLSIILPKLLGIGFYTYKNMESGYKGFYFGGNGINILSVQLMFYCGGQILFEEKDIKKYLVLILNIISTAFIGTKTSILSIVVFAIILAAYPTNSRKKLIGVNMTTVLLLCISAILFVRWNMELIDSIINRLNYEFGRVDGNVVDFLTNSRIKQMFPTVHRLLHDGSIIVNVFLGVGFCKYINVVEMDYIDIFIHFGIIVLFVIVQFYFYCFIKCKSFYYKIVIAFSLCYACMAGHLLISPMGNIALSLIAVISNNHDFHKKVLDWRRLYEKYSNI